MESLEELGALAFFVILWMAISWSLGTFGGWRLLSEYYAHSGPTPKGKSWFKSGRMGWTSYGNVLVVGVTEVGLYLAVLPVFRIGHPPLLVPWRDLSARAKGGWFGRLELRFRQAPPVRLRLQGAYPEIVRRAAGPEAIDGSRPTVLRVEPPQPRVSREAILVVVLAGAAMLGLVLWVWNEN